MPDELSEEEKEVIRKAAKEAVEREKQKEDKAKEN